MRTLCIDPGTYESAFLVWDGRPIEMGFVSNLEMRARLKENAFGGAEIVAIEMIASYGMPVGRETFETVLWIGRFQECAVPPVRLVYRKDVKMHICGATKAKDANVNQALRDKYGEKGTAKSPGLLYGVSKHIWSCVAIADYMDGQRGVIVPGTGINDSRFHVPPHDPQDALPFA